MKNGLATGALTIIAGIAAGFLLLRAGQPAWSGIVFSAFVAALPLLYLYGQLQTRASQLSIDLDLARAAHKEAEAFAGAILDVIPMSIYVKDAESRYLTVNKAHAKQVARDAAEMIGQCSFDFAPNEEVAAMSREEDLAVLNGTSLVKEKHMLETPTGQEQFMVVTKGRCKRSEGKYAIVCSFFDATEWRVAERELKAALERETLLRERTQAFVQRLIDVIPDPFYVQDSNSRLLLGNSALAREQNATLDALVGLDAATIALDEKLAEEALVEDLAVMDGAEIDKEQHVTQTPTGEEQYRHVIKRRCVHIDGDTVIVAAHFNITRWKIAERELARLAHEDSLTGLPNRRGFLDGAMRSISRATRHDEALSLLLFDLDHFKHVNDNHGHPAGDAVLKAVAARLRQGLRAEDLPCRWGGEEFAVLLPQTAAEGAMLVAQRLRSAMEGTPITIDGGTALRITISCGVAQRQGVEMLDQLVERADKALYQAKHAGRNTCLLAA